MLLMGEIVLALAVSESPARGGDSSRSENALCHPGGWRLRNQRSDHRASWNPSMPRLTRFW